MAHHARRGERRGLHLRGHRRADQERAGRMSDLPLVDPPEPEPGSVVMWQGRNGTAVQRHHADGLWHASTGRVMPWSFLVRHSENRSQPLLLIYTPPPRA